MKPTSSHAIAAVCVLLLAGILLAIPDDSVSRAVAGDDATSTITATASSTATGTPAVTLTPTFTPTTAATLTQHVFLPYITRLGTPTPTPTPTLTPTPTPVGFAGTTDQNRRVSLVVSGDLSAVVQLQIPVTVVCEGGSVAHSGYIPVAEGLLIEDGRFSVRLWAGHTGDGEPAYHEYAGEFDAAFSAVEGTWRRWRVVGDQPICDNAGTWNATRRP